MYKFADLSLILLLTGFVYSASAQCPTLVWEDNFDGTTLDLSKWAIQTGDGCDIGLCGWGNNELEWYRAENAVVADGTLSIIAKQEEFGGKRYTSARIRTLGKADWTYGRFEASIKLPQGRGMWPAFWMLSTSEPYGTWPQSGELDIMELVGHEPATVHGTLHYGNAWPNNQSTGAQYELLDGIFNDDFHEFAVEWVEDEIRWYVDGYLFSKKTKLSVSPWPFDHDFHILLNLAVGGDWPGQPSGSGLFPQTMEVDYVRVYNGSAPSIEGMRQVAHQAESITYTVENAAADAELTWSVQEGAEIVSPPSSNAIQVNWGEVGGRVEVQVASPCEDKVLFVDVLVDPPFGKALVLENFDDQALMTFDFSDGALEEDVANPGADDLNSSALCGKYQRDGSATFDILRYEVDPRDIDDATAFEDGEKRFSIDVYTDAPEGTQILLQLERSALSEPTNYPRGRHSRYEAYTDVQGAWQRLEFAYVDSPDGTANDRSIDRIVFLFASNTMTENVYYFDNVDIYAPMSIVSAEEAPIFVDQGFSIEPNPVRNDLRIRNTSQLNIDRIALFDYQSKLTFEKVVSLNPEQNISISLGGVPSGAYLVGAFSSGQRLGLQKVIKQ